MVGNDVRYSPLLWNIFYAFSKVLRYMCFGQVGVGLPVHFLIHAMYSVKINKGRPHENAAGGSARGALLPYHSLSVPHPSRKRRTSQVDILYYPSRRKKGSPPPLTPRPPAAQPVRDCHNSANDSPLCFQLPVYPNGFFVYNSPPNLLLSSVKEHSYPLFGTLASDFPRLLVSDCNSLLFLNKLIFLW